MVEPKESIDECENLQELIIYYLYNVREDTGDTIHLGYELQQFYRWMEEG